MNRLSFLKETLPKNIEDNLEYGNLEFIVLNYNSADELDEWINTEMLQYIEKGILKYIKTTEPKYFLRSHSKNVVSKEASGDIICNVDADNFIGKGFAEFINESFYNDKNIYLFVDENTERDCCGRICLTKDDFTTLRGYDEDLKGYGFEDFDLRNRLKLLGRTFVRIPKENFLNAITHSDVERLENEYNNIGIKHIYIKHKTASMSELVYCFKNNEVYTGCIVRNSTLNSESIQNLFITKESYVYNITLLEDSWKFGQFISYDKIVFKDEDLSIVNKSEYFEVLDDKFCSLLIMLFSQISNRVKMNKNLAENRITVNDESYGDTRLE
ncbi:hypothetical protein ASC72_21315 [Flavobacterium sp. Root420]|nr:hypothetical protein ASC72_21315 [Flavobacterium sp. Root420]